MQPHEILGVPVDASFEEIRAARRRLWQIYHPDRYQQHDEDVQREVTRRMQAANVAYDALADKATHDISYETAGWTDQQRGDLALRLGRMGIMHRWEGIDLVVSSKHEPAIDQLFDEVEF